MDFVFQIVSGVSLDHAATLIGTRIDRSLRSLAQNPGLDARGDRISFSQMWRAGVDAGDDASSEMSSIAPALIERMKDDLGDLEHWASTTPSSSPDGVATKRRIAPTGGPVACDNQASSSTALPPPQRKGVCAAPTPGRLFLPGTRP